MLFKFFWAAKIGNITKFAYKLIQYEQHPIEAGAF